MSTKRNRFQSRTLRTEVLERREMLAADLGLHFAAAIHGAHDAQPAQVRQQTQQATPVEQIQLATRDQLQQRDQLKDGSCLTDAAAVPAALAAKAGDQVKQKDQTRDQLKDGSCVTATTAVPAALAAKAGDQLKQKDQARDQLKDGSCLTDTTAVPAALAAKAGDQVKQKDQTRDQLKDGSCLVDSTAVPAALAATAQTSTGQAQTQKAPVRLVPLSAAEKEGLLFVREEEKLARDVYLTLAQEWNLPIFTNIAASEQAHMDAVKTLLVKYGLADPVVDNTVGVFTNTALQQLYNDLTGDAVADLSYLGLDLSLAGGSSSLLAALEVGAFIEEFDILDIMNHEADVTHTDVMNVYENLLKGSRNHLRSFTSQITALGEEYQPVLMVGDLQDLYDSIVNTSLETGKQNGRPTSSSQMQAVDLAFAQVASAASVLLA
jgi:hypothetical protein